MCRTACLVGRRQRTRCGLMAIGPGSRTPTKRPLALPFRRSGAFVEHWWQVKDSNLRSFRDGFTVRSHWPLGQPAWCAWKDSKPQPAAPNRPEDPWRTARFDIVSKYRQAGGRERRQHRGQGDRQRATTSRTSAPRVELAGEVIKIKANTEERCQGRPRRRRRPGCQAQGLAQAPRRPRGRAAPVRARSTSLDVAPQGGHLPGEREEDHQDHPRRGPEERQERRSRATSCASPASRATTSRPSSGCCKGADLDVALNFTNHR